MTATRLRPARLVPAAIASAGLILSAPAFAQNGPDPAVPYQYAVPAGAVVAGAPVMQPAGQATMEWYDAGAALPLPPPPPPAVPYPSPYPHAGVPGPGSYPAPYPAAAGPRFDRSAWLDDCQARTRGLSKREERASVITGLLGAVAGGVIGNRAYDSERLAGTLIGAGVGGLAGLAIGAAIGAAGKIKRSDECSWYLDRYMGGGFGAHGYAYSAGYPGYGAAGGYGYGYNYGYEYGYGGVAYVPVLVAVPQQQVVRETVTEEWVDVPVRARTIQRTRTKAVHHPAPVRHTKTVSDKRIRYSK
ncbi:glycine zipper 2TM domain-containing protein [Tsuneonella amylolytica]|uniref:glycine zipper 2TM domain-containing protein n=1 Tax=Tsuneonella amylolytica TaxID=2338327 RepID=UPI001892ABF3|nr:glycine zipper 2TM domain-containing protein [Tsuneonella amylolytica]